MRTWRWRSKVLLGLLLLAFAYYVWPTPWACYPVNPSVSSAGGEYGANMEEYTIWLRVNRFTGKVQRLSWLRGWEPSKPKR